MSTPSPIKPTKSPKQLLQEELDKRKQFGAKLVWDPEQLKSIGNGRYRATCSFYRGDGLPVITETAEGLGIKGAEHEVSKLILGKLGIQTSSPTASNSSGLHNLTPISKKPSGGDQSPQNYSSANSTPQRDQVNSSPSSNLSTSKLQADSPTQSNSTGNYVGKLQEYCVKMKYGIPDYTEVHREKDETTQSFTFTMSCKVNGNEKFGNGNQLKIAKQNAAFNMYTHLSAEGMEGMKEDFTGLVKALEGTSIQDSPSSFKNSKPAATSDSQSGKVDQKYKKLLQVSEKIWMDPNKTLGTGGFSEVFEGLKEDESCKVAIKRVKQSEADDPKCKELEILRTTQHENLVTYYFVERLDKYLYIVLELANYSLDSWIRLGNQDNDMLVKVCKDVANGLKHLHKNRVVHRDIKPKNVLIFMREVTGKLIPTAKLTDFGISRILSEDEEAAFTTKGELGTQTYLPPEAKPKMKLELSFDIFPLGILLGFVMTNGQHIFSWPNETEAFEIKSKIKNDKPNWSLVNDNKLTGLKNLLQVMLMNDPTKRGTIGIILEHPFFWSTEESYLFLVKVSKEIKNVGVATDAIVKAKQGFIQDLPDWKLRLDDKVKEWMKERDLKLELSKSHQNSLINNWRKYKGGSIKDLINFIRDQDEHYSNWITTDLEDTRIFGRNDLARYREYFMMKFPELPVLLYNVLQNPEFRGHETSSYYTHNKSSLFELRK